MQLARYLFQRVDVSDDTEMCELYGQIQTRDARVLYHMTGVTA